MKKEIFRISDFDHTWLTADDHFNHANILRYLSRPFAGVDEMNAAMIENWNRVVGRTDIVYHLGDLTLGDEADLYLKQLNGDIRFLAIPWHHDGRWLAGRRPHMGKTGNIRYLPPLHVIYLEELGERLLPVTLSHYPLAEWEASYHGSWHLHGHSHGNYQNFPGFFRVDVGVDCNDFAPVNLSTILDIMKGLGWNARNE